MCPVLGWDSALSPASVPVRSQQDRSACIGAFLTFNGHVDRATCRTALAQPSRSQRPRRRCLQSSCGPGDDTKRCPAAWSSGEAHGLFTFTPKRSPLRLTSRSCVASNLRFKPPRSRSRIAAHKHSSRRSTTGSRRIWNVPGGGGMRARSPRERRRWSSASPAIVRGAAPPRIGERPRAKLPRDNTAYGESGEIQLEA